MRTNDTRSREHRLLASSYFFFYLSLVGFLGDQKRRDRLETRGLCCVLLPFFPRTSHCPSNETTKGTGTKNNARNLPKYALYTGCFISVANWSECSRSNYGRIYKVESCRIPRYHCDPLYGKNYREREVHHRVQPRIYCYSGGVACHPWRGQHDLDAVFCH